MATVGGFKGFVDHDTPDIVCPTCDTKMDGSLNITGEAAPEDGDVSICMYCASFSTFDDGQLRLPTDEEILTYANDSNLRRAQRIIRERMGDLRDR